MPRLTSENVKHQFSPVVPTVSSLEDLAIEASFNALVSYLRQYWDYEQYQEVATVSSSSDFGNQSIPPGSASRDHVVNIIRNYIDQHLVGIVNNKFRMKCLQKLYQSYGEFASRQAVYDVINQLPLAGSLNNAMVEFLMNKKKDGKNVCENSEIDISFFLDCVLNESCEKLTIPVTFPFTEPNPNLTRVVAKRSSLMKKMSINFHLMKKETKIENLAPVILSLSSLPNLTSLTLKLLYGQHKSVIKLLGKSCPSLAHLEMGCAFYLDVKDLLALILGELGEHLFPVTHEKKSKEESEWREENVLRTMRVPAELLPPMCSSLRHLSLENVEWVYDETHFYSPVVFVLNHLPLLEQFDGFVTGIAAHNLQDSSLYVSKRDQREFEEYCRATAAALKELPNEPSSSMKEESNIPTEPSLFSGTLMLTKLECVSAVHVEMIPIIGSVCPLLKDVQFTQNWPNSRRLYEEPTAEEVGASLKDWPKLESITTFNLPTDYVGAIVNSFAPSLKRLTLRNCWDIKVSDLKSLLQLKSLRIKKPTTRLEAIKQDKSGPDGFLPKLTSLESQICLGSWNHLFEEKSGLTHVLLNCCHIGTKGSRCKDWIRLPEMWPDLEALHIVQCSGLTLPMVPNIVLRLGSLKELSLPESVRGNDPSVVEDILELFKNRPIPVQLRFIPTKTKQVPCPFMNTKK